jgi:hypothetical protein
MGKASKMLSSAASDSHIISQVHPHVSKVHGHWGWYAQDERTCGTLEPAGPGWLGDCARAWQVRDGECEVGRQHVSPYTRLSVPASAPPHALAVPRMHWGRRHTPSPYRSTQTPVQLSVTCTNPSCSLAPAPHLQSTTHLALRQSPALESRSRLCAFGGSFFMLAAAHIPCCREGARVKGRFSFSSYSNAPFAFISIWPLDKVPEMY